MGFSGLQETWDCKAEEHTDRTGGEPRARRTGTGGCMKAHTKLLWKKVLLIYCGLPQLTEQLNSPIPVRTSC